MIANAQFTALISLLTGMSLMTGCGAPDRFDRPSDSSRDSSDALATEEPETKDPQPSTDGEPTFDQLVIPPVEYYEQAFGDAVSRSDDASFGLVDSPQILWVNFDGATLSKGFARNESFILCKQQATIDAPGFSPADQQSILEMVQEFFDKSGSLLILTKEKPAAGDFTTIHVGGAFTDLGCRGSGVLGVAPFDVGNTNRNDVGFAFTRNISSLRVIAETIAHESGHSFGLEHVESRTDLMFASATQDITGFGVSRINGSGKIQDAPAILQNVLGLAGSAPAPSTPVAGSGSQQNPVTPPAIPGIPNLPPNLASLPGLGQLGSLAGLIPGLAGAGAGNILDISTLLPLAQTVFPAAAGAVGLNGLDQILTVIGLAGAAANNQQNPGAAITSLIPLGNAGGLTTILNSLTGQGAGGLASLANLAGLGNLGSAVGILQGVLGGAALGGNTSSPSPIPAVLPAQISQLPDLASLIGLNPATTSLPALINNFTGTAQVINGNFAGSTRDALLSMIKVAYGQAVQQSITGP